jgi:hypothetical protein
MGRRQLPLMVDGDTGVRYADNRTARRPIVRDMWLELCGRGSDFTAVVEPDWQDALIGAIVLEELDLIVDCTRGEVRPRDPDRIISEIELNRVHVEAENGFDETRRLVATDWQSGPGPGRGHRRCSRNRFLCLWEAGGILAISCVLAQFAD